MSVSHHAAREVTVYTFKVTLIEGPLSFSFAWKNPEISRTIRIPGGQSFGDLHEAVFHAFNRTSRRLYEFQFDSNHGDWEESDSYALPGTRNPGCLTLTAEEAEATTIESRGLVPGDCIGYWFDFDFGWLHTVRLLSVEREAPGGSYPDVAGRVGESPPQHPDWNEVIMR